MANFGGQPFVTDFDSVMASYKWQVSGGGSFQAKVFQALDIAHIYLHGYELLLSFIRTDCLPVHGRCQIPPFASGVD